LGIDVKNNFKPYYVNISIRKKQITELKELVKKCSETILASDEDREGEAIAWHVKHILEDKNLLKGKK